MAIIQILLLVALAVIGAFFIWLAIRKDNEFLFMIGILVCIAIGLYVLWMSLSDAKTEYTPISKDKYSYTKFEGILFVVHESGTVSIIKDKCSFDHIEEGLVKKKNSNAFGCSMGAVTCVERCCEYQSVTF